MLGWGLLIAFIFISIFFSYWFLLPMAILCIWKAYQYWFYNGRPWRCIHYPAMRLYSSVAGQEAGDAETESREFDFTSALSQFLGALKPTWSLDEIESFIDREIKRSNNFEDKELIKKYVLKNKKKITESQIDNALNEFSSLIDPADKAWIIRMIIAGVIETQYGQDDRGEYLYEVMVGNAK